MENYDNAKKKKYSIDSNTAKSYLKAYGIPSKKDLENMYVKQGNSTKEIADKLGISSSSIKRYFNTYGIPTKKKGFYRNMSKMTNEEFINYGKEKGYSNMTRMDLRKKNYSFYLNGLKRGLINKIIPKSIYGAGVDWKNVSNDEMTTIAKQRGYDKMTRSELLKKDYSFYLNTKKKGLLSHLTGKIPTNKELAKMYAEDYTNGMSISDIAEKYKKYLGNMKKRGDDDGMAGCPAKLN